MIVGTVVNDFANFTDVIASVVLALALIDPLSTCGKAEFSKRSEEFSSEYTVPGVL